MKSSPAGGPVAVASPTYAYGSTRVAARWCGLDRTPKYIGGVWQHGWLLPDLQIGPAAVACLPLDNHSKRLRIWVARPDEQAYLRSHGYANARAIGLPFAYAAGRHVESAPQRTANGSLLVMPMHSLSDLLPGNDFEAYLDQIADLRNDFSRVAVCVHPDCYRRGDINRAAERRGFEVIRGADYFDPDALYQLSDRLAEFEYMTTNGHGSHIAYASALGLKVSLLRYDAPRASDRINTDFYVRYFEYLKPTIAALSESRYRHQYPWLFVEHPRDANQHIRWGRDQIGFDQRLPPEQLRRELGWSMVGRVQQATRRAGHQLWRRMPGEIRRLGSLCTDVDTRNDWLDRGRVAALRNRIDPRWKRRGQLRWKGRRLRFDQLPSAATELETAWIERPTEFQTLKQRPLIVDLDAGHGFEALADAARHRDATIYVDVTDEPKRDVLRNNVQSETSVIECLDWSPSQHQCWWDGLAELAHSISLLRVVIGPSAHSMPPPDGHWHRGVDRMRLRIHERGDQPQRLPELMVGLSQAGFRLHLRNVAAAERPLMRRPIVDSCDHHVELYAFRPENLEGVETVDDGDAAIIRVAA